MKKIRYFLLIIFFVESFSRIYSQNNPNWHLDFGFHFFKYSASGIPNEIQYNPVFSRWEGINQNSISYHVSEYQPLKPLYFNMNFGIDFFIRYTKHLLIKVGYDYSNPFGFGGDGNITYLNRVNGSIYNEVKKFSYISHQFNYFIGPLIQVGDKSDEIYLGFSPMSPTWVTYKEQYKQLENGITINNYDKIFNGVHGSCQALIGIQVSVIEKFRIGSEAVFSFLNYMELKSGDMTDYSFQFPGMKWNITLRYEVF